MIAPLLLCRPFPEIKGLLARGQRFTDDTNFKSDSGGSPQLLSLPPFFPPVNLDTYVNCDGSFYRLPP